MSTADSHGRTHGEPEEPHGVTVPMPHHHVNYFAIFGALVVLTIITVSVYFLHPSSELVKILLALLIASVKAILVAYFFMHLKFEGKLIYTIFIVPLILCVLLVVALIPDVLRGPVMDNRPVFSPIETPAGGEHGETVGHH
jgi:cytochrome c oxidase subunit 4